MAFSRLRPSIPYEGKRLSKNSQVVSYATHRSFTKQKVFEQIKFGMSHIHVIKVNLTPVPSSLFSVGLRITKNSGPSQRD